MSINAEYRNRQLIPRWHPFNVARILGYTEPAIRGKDLKIWTPESYKDKETAWLTNGTISHATDFVGTALLANDYTNANAKNACEYIIKNRSKASRLVNEIALSFSKKMLNRAEEKVSLLIGDPELKVRQQIQRTRLHLRGFPIDPIMWTDLAFYYTLIYKFDKARRCIETATQIAPSNRHVLRSAARFYIHIGEPEKALFLLRKFDVAKSDPWLIAAELSICETFSKSSKYKKIGLEFVNDESIHPQNKSELCAALGTLEINHGEIKKAKRLFKCSLISPNENVIAQVEWIEPRANLNINSRNTEVPGLFEANTRKKMKEGAFDCSFDEALMWQEFQQFSSKPGVLGSYIAMLGLEDYKKALLIIEKAEISSPNDAMLLNNKACALASLNNINEAIETINRIDVYSLENRENGTFSATLGLINFRLGNFEKGRLLYDKAINIFETTGETPSIAIACFYRGREEDRIGSETADLYLNRAFKLAQKHEQKELLKSIESVLKSRKRK